MLLQDILKIKNHNIKNIVVLTDQELYNLIINIWALYIYNFDYVAVKTGTENLFKTIYKLSYYIYKKIINNNYDFNEKTLLEYINAYFKKTIKGEYVNAINNIIDFKTKQNKIYNEYAYKKAILKDLKNKNIKTLKDIELYYKKWLYAKPKTINQEMSQAYYLSDYNKKKFFDYIKSFYIKYNIDITNDYKIKLLIINPNIFIKKNNKIYKNKNSIIKIYNIIKDYNFYKYANNELIDLKKPSILEQAQGEKQNILQQIKT